MPRYLVISLLILLIMGVVGGTIVLITGRLKDDEAEEQTTPGQLDPGAPGQPSDTRPDGERELIPLDEAPGAPVAVDQYFSTNLDLTGGNQNLTELYNRQYNQEERTPDTLAQFARSQPILTQLPRPVDRAINMAASDTPRSLAQYMQIAGNLNVFSNRHILTEAIHELFSNKNPSVMNGLVMTVRAHQEKLVVQSVPPSAINLHRLLLGYSELLAATYEQMALYPQDPVRGVTAMHQLEQIDKKFYPIIEAEVERVKGIQSRLSSN